MVNLPLLSPSTVTGHRLVNSKFPPINLFDDVGTGDDFDVAFALQELVNPRIQTEVGDLTLLARNEIPFGITGCSYAVAPFTHVNPEGSRFSQGDFGVLYLADSTTTAIAEVLHHQRNYWEAVPALQFDRFVFRGLVAKFKTTEMHNASDLPLSHPIYSATDYTASQQFGSELRKVGSAGLQYNSVRNQGALCWGLFTPRHVVNVIQSAHYEMIWGGQTAPVQVCKISRA